MGAGWTTIRVKGLTPDNGLNFGIMEKSERLGYIVNALCRGSQAQFARETGLDKFSLNKMIKGTAGISERTITMIVERYPMVNADYLRGESEFPGDLTPTRTKSKDEIIAEKDAEISYLRKSIDLLGRLVDDLEKVINKTTT